MTTNAALSIAEILSAFVFGDFRPVDTRAGKRLVRSARIPDEVRSAFWDSWNTRKPEWKEQGYDISKFTGAWEVVQWLNADGTITEQAKSRAQEAREESGDGALPVDWIPGDVRLESEVSAKLFEYQKPGALRLKRALSKLDPPIACGAEHQKLLAGANANAMDASDTGTGKTFVALAAAAELNLTPCVIAPLAVLPSWQRAAQFLGVRLGFVVNYEKLRAGRTGIGKFNEKGEWQFDYLPKNPLLIWDECQKCKAADTKNSAMLRGSVGAGFTNLALSATAAKDPTEMRALGFMLGFHDGSTSGWRAWCMKNGCKDGRYGLKYAEKKKKTALEKLHRQIFPLKGNRIRVADLPEFPETQILSEAMDTGNTDAIRGAYDEMDMAIERIFADGSLDGRQKGAQTLAEIMKARKAAELGKLDLFQELAEEALEEDHSVVIFLNFRAHCQEMASRLKTKNIIWGSDMNGRAQKPEERQTCIDRFQADEDRVCIISLQAGGAGLSLHDLNGNYPRAAIISPSYSAVDLKQALGRIHRAGAKTKSRQRIVFAAGTIEEEICASIREKLANIDSLNDGHLAPPSILRNVKLTSGSNGDRVPEAAVTATVDDGDDIPF